MEKKKIANLIIKKVEEPCRHPAIFKSMCVSCGMTIRPSSPSSSQATFSSDGSNRSQVNNSSSLLFAGGNRLLLSKDEALRVQTSKSLGLKSSLKLALVLDLDHTLVHATGAWPGYAAALGPLLGDGGNDIRKIFIEEGPGMQPKCYLVKLRPHLESFLKEAHALCQMTIYTAGTRLYAEAVAKLIDPLGIYFAQRIVSRSDIPNDKSDGMEKSLERIFLEDASMVVVMDDREDVWRGEQAAQLLLVRPFHYFTGCEEVNNAAGSAAVSSGPLIRLSGDRPGSRIDPNDPSLARPLTIGTYPIVSANNDHDDQLPRCISIIKQIHQRFFSAAVANATASEGNKSDSLLTVAASQQVSRCGVTVANIINDMKLSILAGCTITFSGVIPVRTTVEQHSAWQLAESMGARITTEVTAETTHLLTVSMPPAANGQGQPGLTSKAKECLVRGDVWVLHPDWLSYCRFSLAKAVESTFVLIAQTPGRPLPDPVMRPHSRGPPSSSSALLPGSSSRNGSEIRVRFSDEVVDYEEDSSGNRKKRRRYDVSEEERGGEREGGVVVDGGLWGGRGSSEDEHLIEDNNIGDSVDNIGDMIGVEYEDVEAPANHYISEEENEEGEEGEEGDRAYRRDAGWDNDAAGIDEDGEDYDGDGSDDSSDDFESAILQR